MEVISVDGQPAPRLARARPGPELLREWFEQLRSAMVMMARHGIAHGDLSAYNIPAQGERVVIIDLPQAVDLVGNAQGLEVRMGDSRHACTGVVLAGLDRWEK